LSDAERVAMWHKAIDARMSLGEFLRGALGLPPRREVEAPMS
jgi:hypothetical protein